MCIELVIIVVGFKLSYIDKILKSIEYCWNEIIFKDIKVKGKYLSSLKYIWYEL